MLNKLNKQFFIIISGPSGVGKTTIVKNILSFYGSQKMETIISHTTRPLRGKEQNAKEYYFITKKQFIELQQKKAFAEWAFVYGNYYGTSKKQILQHWDQGKIIIKDLDLQGAQSMKQLYPQSLSVFIAPPSIKELSHRITKRKENQLKDIQIRTQQAKAEIKKTDDFDYTIKNIDLQKTTEKLKKIIEEYIK